MWRSAEEFMDEAAWAWPVPKRGRVEEHRWMPYMTRTYLRMYICHWIQSRVARKFVPLRVRPTKSPTLLERETEVENLVWR